MEFLAHRRETESGVEIQTAAEHCRNVSARAGECLAPAGLRQAAALAGLVHDCGKFKAEFARYLADSRGVRGSVNHTFAGFRLLMEWYHGHGLSSTESLSAELLALAAGSHHGVFDCVDETGESGMRHRMTKADIGYEESKHNFLAQCVSEEEMDRRFAAAHQELLCIYGKIDALTADAGEAAFHLGLLARLLLSAVIEGDRRDTAIFMRGLPPPPREMAEGFWEPYLNRMENKLAEFAQDTPISRARAEISARCRDFASKPGGIYRLNVPTGAGKTLSSLRYALAHAQKWSKRRLIFVSPLLSILEQNAAVLRSFIGDDRIILEHHSNVLRTEEDGELNLLELAQESWDAPVIITTLVQLLNTLFDGKTTAIRRFQGLCGSVIIIDEVQTVPPRMLTLFNLAIDFLAKVCDATVLLCSATQPYLEGAAHPLRSETGDVVPYDKLLWEPFRRTVITDAGGKTLEEIAEYARDAMEQTQSLLVVCNRKDEAEYLFSRLRGGADMACHLSASMCTEHRRKVLAELRMALEAGRKCLCVATQVIEAGVDISFRRVIRLAAGMDSVIQAAGRCNRHGESAEPVPVFIVSCQGEYLGRLREIREAKEATISLLDDFRRRPERFESDLSSDAAIRAYYQKLYQNMAKGYQDYSIEEPKTSLFALLSNNLEFYGKNAPGTGEYLLNQAFKLAGSRFEVFDGGTRDLIVPYEKGAELIVELAGHPNPDAAFLADWAKRAKPYSVAVYEWQLKRLGNAVREYSGAAVLSDGFYDENTGLTLRPENTDFLEV